MGHEGSRACIGRKRSKESVDKWKKTIRERCLNDNEYKIRRDAHLLKMMKNSKLKYNLSEQLLEVAINYIVPNQYKYNGGGELGFKIFSHIPDFMNVNGQKKIINLNGCAFHCCPVCGLHHPFKVSDEKVREQDRKNLESAKKLGYEVLIVWEHELNNLDNVAQKIGLFNEL
jgi:hypothetical protein